MTTIKVNGTTINIGGARATESVVLADPDTALAEATEAYVIANVKVAAACTMADAASRSGEAAPAWLQKVGAGLKKAWEAIINFFRKIIHYITSFFQAAIPQMRANHLLKVIDKNGLPASWTKPHFTAKLVKKAKDVIVMADKNAKVATKAKAYLDKINATPDDNPTSAEQAAKAFMADAAIQDVMQFAGTAGEAKQLSADTTVGAFFGDMGTMRSLLDEIAHNTFKNLVAMKLNNDASKDALNAAIKASKKAGAKSDSAKIKALRGGIKVINGSVRLSLQATNIIIQAASLAVNSGKTLKKEGAAAAKAEAKKGAAKK